MGQLWIWNVFEFLLRKKCSAGETKNKKYRKMHRRALTVGRIYPPGKITTISTNMIAEYGECFSLMDQLEKSAEGWKLSNLAQLRCKLRPRWIQLRIHSLQSCFIHRHSSTVLASGGTGSHWQFQQEGACKRITQMWSVQYSLLVKGKSEWIWLFKRYIYIYGL